MSIVLECNKGEGSIIGNMLRKYSLMRLPSWRPIAFRVEKEGTNILHSSPDMLQSMIEFSQNLSELQFEAPAGSRCGDLIEQHLTFSSELNSNDLSTNSIVCKTENVALLNTITSGSTNISVYYRHAYGVSTINQNLMFLQEKGLVVDNSEIKVISSIHSEVTKFTYDIEPSALDKENLVIKMDNNFGNLEAKETLSEVINLASERLNTIKAQF